MDKIVVNVQTGQVSIVALTPEEIAAIPPPPQPDFGIINSKALVRRRADELQQQGKPYDALLLLKTIGE